MCMCLCVPVYVCVCVCVCVCVRERVGGRRGAWADLVRVNVRGLVHPVLAEMLRC